MVTEEHIIEPIDLRKLNIQQMNAIDLLVLGGSDREVAEKVGVDRSTITRWRNYHPAFQAELNAQREAIWGGAKEKLRSLLPETVDVLAETIRDRNNPDRVRVSLEIIKVVKLSEEIGHPGLSDPDDIIRAAADNPIKSLIIQPNKYTVEVQEARIQAKLLGMTLEEYFSLRDEDKKRQEGEEKYRRIVAKEVKKRVVLLPAQEIQLDELLPDQIPQ